MTKIWIKWGTPNYPILGDGKILLPKIAHIVGILVQLFGNSMFSFVSIHFLFMIWLSYYELMIQNDFEIIPRNSISIEIYEKIFDICFLKQKEPIDVNKNVKIKNVYTKKQYKPFQCQDYQWYSNVLWISLTHKCQCEYNNDELLALKLHLPLPLPLPNHSTHVIFILPCIIQENYTPIYTRNNIHLCVFIICFLKTVLYDDLKSHSVQENTFSPLCLFIWTVRLDLTEHL